MPLRKIKVRKHQRKKPGGGKTSVREHLRNIFKRKLPGTRKRDPKRTRIKDYRSREKWQRVHTLTGGSPKDWKGDLWQNPYTGEAINRYESYGRYAVIIERSGDDYVNSFRTKKAAGAAVGRYMKTGDMSGFSKAGKTR